VLYTAVTRYTKLYTLYIYIYIYIYIYKIIESRINYYYNIIREINLEVIN